MLSKDLYSFFVVAFLLILSILLSNSVKVDAESAKSEFVRNLTVQVLENAYGESEDSLRMSISWLPPAQKRVPKSYSVSVTSFGDGASEIAECPEGSLYLATQNASQLTVLLPQHKCLLDSSELCIRPNCSYEIQVYPNPRRSPKATSVIYKVPECIGRYCSCAKSKEKLPKPTVSIQEDLSHDGILIMWNGSTVHHEVQRYIISFGIPILMSNQHLPVYNITQIASVSSNHSTYLWSVKNIETKLQLGGELIVTASDKYGCLGPEGVLTILPKDVLLTGKVYWVVIFGMMTACGAFGVLYFLGYYKSKYHRTCTEEQNECLKTLSKENTQWAHIQKNQNILYPKLHIQDTLYGDHVDEYEIPYERIEAMQEIGHGQFGKVYLGTLKGYDQLIAIKISKYGKLDTYNNLEARKELLEEIYIMKSVGAHPNLVGLIGYCTLPKHPLCILLEYMAGGDLLSHLHFLRESFVSNDIFQSQPSIGISQCINETKYNHNAFMKSGEDYIQIKDASAQHYFQRLTRGSFLKYALEIAQGMKYLETKGIIHRDLAARNILLDGNQHVKISDFGLSRNSLYVTQMNNGCTRCLPVRWMSPEALRERIFSSKSDVWSYGVVLWEIGTLGSFPYADIQDDRIIEYLLSPEVRLRQPEGLHDDIYKMMCLCWQSRPLKRPSFASLVSRIQNLCNIPLLNFTKHCTTNPCYVLNM